jgi:hypothetical protein
VAAAVDVGRSCERLRANATTLTATTATTTAMIQNLRITPPCSDRLRQIRCAR